MTVCAPGSDFDPILMSAGPNGNVALSVDTAVADYLYSNRLLELCERIQSYADARDFIAAFTDALDELRRTQARAPRWVDCSDAVALYGVPAKTIKEWATNGFVRKAKLGPTFQSKTLYSADDLHDVLCRFAAGKQPLNALGRGV